MKIAAFSPKLQAKNSVWPLRQGFITTTPKKKEREKEEKGGGREGRRRKKDWHPLTLEIQEKNGRKTHFGVKKVFFQMCFGQMWHFQAKNPFL